MYHNIRSLRLTFVPPSLEYAADVARLISHADVMAQLPGLPVPYTLQDAESFIEASANDHGRVWFVLCGDELIGGASIRGSLSYWLAPTHWGRGFGTEIADKLADIWFVDPKAEDLPAGHLDGNAASAHVLAKAGFRYTGETRVDHSAIQGRDVENHRMALTRGEWRTRREYRLSTERLTLRELRHEDWPEIQRIGGDPRVAPNLAVVPLPWPRARVHAWIEAQRYRGRPHFRLAICLDGRLIGTVYFGRPPWAKENTLAYFIDPDHWGNGYATEAARALCSDAMARFDIKSLCADHFADNPASGAVLRNLGFVETGRSTAESAARLEPGPIVIYRLDADQLKAPKS